MQNLLATDFVALQNVQCGMDLKLQLEAFAGMNLNCNPDSARKEVEETDIVGDDLVSALERGPNRD